MFEDLESHLSGVQRRRNHFEPGETLFRVGDQVRALHFVTGGTIHLMRHQRGGAPPLVMQRASAGAVLAEASLYSDRYHCDAVAIFPTTTTSIAKSALLKAMAESPALALAWARRLALDVQQARLQTEVLALKTVSARLDAWLACNDGLPAKGGRKGLAAEIGVSPEALYRELSRRRTDLARR